MEPNSPPTYLNGRYSEEILGKGWTPLPNILLSTAKDLGLTPNMVALYAAIQSWPSGEPVTDGQIMARASMSQSTITRTKRAMLKLTTREGVPLVKYEIVHEPGAGNRPLGTIYDFTVLNAEAVRIHNSPDGQSDDQGFPDSQVEHRETRLESHSPMVKCEFPDGQVDQYLYHRYLSESLLSIKNYTKEIIYPGYTNPITPRDHQSPWGGRYITIQGSYYIPGEIEGVPGESLCIGEEIDTPRESISTSIPSVNTVTILERKSNSSDDDGFVAVVREDIDTPGESLVQSFPVSYIPESLALPGPVVHTGESLTMSGEEDRSRGGGESLPDANYNQGVTPYPTPPIVPPSLSPTGLARAKSRGSPGVRRFPGSPWPTLRAQPIDRQGI